MHKFRDWINDDLSEQIWQDKYQYGDESFDHWLDRVSNNNPEVKRLILQKKFLFGGRILAYRGINDRKLTYSNCYVLNPPEDSIEGIYKTASELARTFSYGGGCGIDISNLRPKGSPVNNAAMTTSGAVSFMDTYNQVSATIGQEGRRGALMISMDVNHDDIHEFVNSKKNTDKLEGCNISVRVDNLFMTRVVAGDGDANKLFYDIVENNYNYAEPGLLYWDNINQNNLLSDYIKSGEFEYGGVNPCAEEPLPPGGSCLLGSMNLSEYVEEPFTDKAAFNIPEFKKDVVTAIRALNDVLDEGIDRHPLEIQRNTVKKWRQIGLGIMGFGDCLVKLGIEYGSDRCLDIIDTIGHAMVVAGLYASALLAEEKGAFEMFNPNKILNSEYIKNVGIDDDLKDYISKVGLRNSQIFTIAPTGTISTMLQISGGVEPIFSYDYTRTTKSLNGGQEKTYNVVTPVIEEALKEYPMTMPLPPYITWASKIAPYNRVLTQAKWQRYIDASISSTVNLDNSCTLDDIYNIYIKAWELGCKGITIYRAGCEREAILKEPEERGIQDNFTNPIECVNDTSINICENDTDINNCVGVGTKLQTGCGSLWVTAYFHEATGQLCHVFLDKGSKGGCNSFMIGLSRTISMLGKLGAPIEEIADQLLSVAPCPSYMISKDRNGDVSAGKCCPDAIGRALTDLKHKFEGMSKPKQDKVLTLIDEEPGIDCPRCGASLINTGGCNICQNCGWSKCE